MAELKQEIDTRDKILTHLKYIERDLGWLATKTGYKYATLYSIFIQRTFDITDERLGKINEVLETNF